MQQQLKIIYQCDGQKVPEDIRKAESTDLIARGISMMKRHNSEYDDALIEQNYGNYVVHNPIGQRYEH